MLLKFEASRLLTRGGRAGRRQGQALYWLPWMLMPKSTPSNSPQALISTSPVSSSQLMQDKGSSISTLYKRPVREVVPTSHPAPSLGPLVSPISFTSVQASCLCEDADGIGCFALGTADFKLAEMDLSTRELGPGQWSASHHTSYESPVWFWLLAAMSVCFPLSFTENCTQSLIPAG